MKKVICLLMVLFIVAVPALAADWTGLGDGTNWGDGGNWSAGVPGSSDSVLIDTQPGANAVIPSGTNAVGASLNIGGTSWDTLPGGGIDWGGSDTLTVELGGTFVSSGLTELAVDATLNVNGFCRQLGIYSRSYSEVVVNDSGSLIFNSGWWFFENTAKLTLNGGELRVASLNGKPSEVAAWSHAGGIDIYEGKMYFRTNCKSALETAVNNDWIIGYGGDQDVVVEYDATGGIYGTLGTTTVYAVPEPATLVMLGIGSFLLRKKRN